MKRLLVAFFSIVSLSSAEVIYTDGNKDIDICVKKSEVASIDVQCPVKDIYFTKEINAEIQKTNPNTVVFILKKKYGSLTAVCPDRSYVFEVKAGRCDLKKTVIDTTISKRIDIDISKFNKEQLLNKARNLMAGMVKGKIVRGYDLKPIKIERVINNDDYFKIIINKIYIGGRLIGYEGEITNYSKYISKEINIPLIMKKGYILLYIQGMENEKVIFRPEETKKIFIVALKNADKIPYVR